MIANVNSHFSQNPPRADIQRSKFSRPQKHITTFSAGKLIPVYIDEVLPGDTFSIRPSVLCRMSTPIFPVMDDCFLDLYAFFSPDRLLWERFQEFMGENKTAPWFNEQNANLKIPSITDGLSEGQTTQIPTGSVGDYLGLPVGVNIPADEQISDLPFRMYQLVWNEFFRSENVDTPVLVNLGSTGSDTVAKGQPYSVARYHDYFSDALPAPQKGPSVAVPLASNVPIVTGPDATGLPNDRNIRFGSNVNSITEPLYLGLDISDHPVASDLFAAVDPNEDPTGFQGKLFPINLWANLEGVGAFDVNALRLAFQVQKLYEADARGGTRYTEILRSHFAVQAPDSRLQRPELIGAEHIPLNMDQVLQTSSTDEVSPQGNTAAFSKTVFRGSTFTKSFVEHGFVMIVACVRTRRTYQQGLERFWSRRGRLDLYWPVLANLGEQPVRKREIYWQTSKASNDVPFGYQEAWAEYRYKPNRVSGYMRSGISGSLDSWHYADYYTQAPTLSSGWLAEGNANVARTLAVQEGAIADCQFICDFAFYNDSVRPMPTWSIPGLIDHH